MIIKTLFFEKKTRTKIQSPDSQSKNGWHLTHSWIFLEKLYNKYKIAPSSEIYLNHKRSCIVTCLFTNETSIQNKCELLNWWLLFIPFLEYHFIFETENCHHLDKKRWSHLFPQNNIFESRRHQLLSWASHHFEFFVLLRPSSGNARNRPSNTAPLLYVSVTRLMEHTVHTV